MTDKIRSPEQLVKQFQCIGCVAGPDPKTCPKYRPSTDRGQIGCEGHVPGTHVNPGGRIMLGLPRGFNKVGPLPEGATTPIRLWEPGSTGTDWNRLNVPVWAQDIDGDRFVRTFLPRLNTGFVDVIPDGAGQDWPSPAIDVGDFITEID